MLLFLAIFGIFLTIILLQRNIRTNKSSSYLGVFFLLLSLYSLHKYLLLHSESIILLSIVYIHVDFLFYLIGPVLYWYVRGVLTDNSHLKIRDLWHLLPMLLFLATALPYLLTPYSYKVEIATTIVNDDSFWREHQAIVLNKIFSNASIYMSRLILVLAYTLWSTGLFISFLIKKEKSMVLSRQHFMTHWLSLLLGFTFIVVISQILLMFKTFLYHDSGIFFTLNVFQILSAAGLAGLLISPFFFPEILYGLPRIPESTMTWKPSEGNKDPLCRNVKNRPPNLESHYLFYIEQKADSCMKELQPYLQRDFNLPHLAVMIDVPVHHLNYFFREVKQQSFHDYRNEWRIKHAKSLLKRGKANDVTLETIGYMCGFSNRNSFRITFEKLEGISPSVFASQIPE